MLVYGVAQGTIEQIAADLDLEIENLRTQGRGVALKLNPHSSRSTYARRSGHGRCIKAVCYHGFRDFAEHCFDAGATRVKSMVGDWATLDDFANDLPRLAALNMGSRAQPARMIDLCACDEDDTLVKAFAVAGL